MILHNLANVLRGYGLTVVEIDGWQNRGYAGQDLQRVGGVLWHHTATGRAAFMRSDAPTLNLCLNGRSDLPGPLCNIVLGRTGIVYILAAGVGNHAGRGDAYDVPTDMGNHQLIGIEMESSGIAPFDWTEDQLRVAPYLGAALELGYLMQNEVQIQIAHSEYSSEGKIDPAGWPGGMDGLRNQINSKIAELQGGAAQIPVGDPATGLAPDPVPSQVGAYVPDDHWVVEKGETLFQVAKHFGVSVDEVAVFNAISAPAYTIYPGERLWSPKGRYDTWKMEKGDTLAGIVSFYSTTHGHNVTVDQLCNANGINDVAAIPVGVRLVIPA